MADETAPTEATVEQATEATGEPVVPTPVAAAVVAADPVETAGKKTPAGKTLSNTSPADLQANVPDVVLCGDGDAWQVLCKAHSRTEGWMKCTKAMEVPGVGCLVQITTQQGDAIAEAVTFVPGARIQDDINGGRKLVKS